MRLPSQPWRSPATARAGCPPPAPSGAAGWSRWCPVRRWGCALCSCRWRSLRPGGRRRTRRTGRGVVTWCEAEDVFLLSLFFPRLRLLLRVQQSTCWFGRPAFKRILQAHFLGLSHSFPALWNAAADTERRRRPATWQTERAEMLITTRWKIPVLYESRLKVRRRDYLFAMILTVC